MNKRKEYIDNERHRVTKQPESFCDGGECNKCSFIWFMDKARPEYLKGIDIEKEWADNDNKYK